jgi:phenylpropionate dioxygenase-like ring-hydroxylating dioxygenase large terminal subunit
MALAKIVDPAQRPYATTDHMWKWRHRYPHLGTGPVPVEPYVSPEYFARERDLIFRRAWLYMGRVDEIPRPGDYFVKTIELLGVSLLFVRGDDGEIRAFHNVCRHRGSRLVDDTRGSVTAFTCPYHAFTYDRKGRLCGVPCEGYFYDLDRSRLSLAPVATDTWRGAIFASLEPRESLPEHLGELYPLYEGFPFEQFVVADRWRAVAHCNWKTLQDAFLEGFHASAFGLHKDSLGSVLVNLPNGVCDLPDIRLYARWHRGYSVVTNPRYQPWPTEGLALRHMGAERLMAVGGELEKTPGVNPHRVKDWTFDAAFIFPNLDMIMGASFGVFRQFWPVSVDRTVMEETMLFLPPANAADRIAQEVNRSVLRDTFAQDIVTSESQHASNRSGAIRELQVSDLEILLRHTLHVADEYMSS